MEEDEKTHHGSTIIVQSGKLMTWYAEAAVICGVANSFRTAHVTHGVTASMGMLMSGRPVLVLRGNFAEPQLCEESAHTISVAVAYLPEGCEIPVVGVDGCAN